MMYKLVISKSALDILKSLPEKSRSIVNRKIKASVHLAVFSAFAAVLGILYGGIFWGLVLLIPVVAWSRIKLKRHKIHK